MKNMREYDAFLSYNNQDINEVTYLALHLAHWKIKFWLAQYNLVPGEPWQENTSEALENSASCIIFIGTNGIGDWQKLEIQLALNQQVKSNNNFRVIPVFLPGCQRKDFISNKKKSRNKSDSQLIQFLNPYTWVEFKNNLDEENPLHVLISGIKGNPPGPLTVDFLKKDSIIEETLPYQGLDYFDVDKAKYYFGREELVAEFLRKIQSITSTDRQRFLVIIGPSGSGKSSFVRAGLIYKINQEEVFISENYKTILFTPGIDPVRNMAIELVRFLNKGANIDEIEKLEKKLLEDNTTLELQVKINFGEAHHNQPVVLIIDQFEEVYTLCKDEAKKNAFIDNLIYATKPGTKNLFVIVSMRADFYHNCFDNNNLANILSTNQVPLPPMDKKELITAIVKPAELAECCFESGLVERLISELERSYIGLPLLEHVLLELWRRRQNKLLTHEIYETIGGVAGALEKHAETVYSQFNEKEQETCKRVFLRLIQPVEGSTDTRRRAVINELVFLSDSQSSFEVLRILTSPSVRLIVTSGSLIAEGRGYAEIIHESLIHNWKRLRSWVDEDREGFRILHRLINSAREWSEHQEDRNFLYQGANLTEALAWAKTNEDKLNELEIRFLKQSHRKSLVLKSMATAALGLIILSALIAVYYARHERSLRIEIKRNSDDLKLKQLHQKLSEDWLDKEKLEGWLKEAEEFADPIDRQVNIDADLDKRLRDFRYAAGGDFTQASECLERLEKIKRETVEKQKDKWEQAIKTIYENPLYKSLKIEPIEGLIPLGEDKDSHLYEFAHYMTGKIPEKDENGNFIITEQSAMILVLLPGGTFKMGSEETNPAEKNTLPVQSITLAPFFVSKYEMTQGQWEQITFSNPSIFKVDLLHPVEYITWDDALVRLNKIGLNLPTEAQWEYAARGDTQTKWWTGDDPAEAEKAGVVSTVAYTRETTAVVTEGRANKFGLFGVIGNVWEWCLDNYCNYSVVPKEGNGERDCPSKVHIFRGGSYFSPGPENARVSLRRSYPAQYQSGNMGVRPIINLVKN